MAKVSAREVEVIEWLLDGLPVPAIAQQMHLTQKQVEAQVRAIYRKFDVSNRKELRLAYRSTAVHRAWLEAAVDLGLEVRSPWECPPKSQWLAVAWVAAFGSTKGTVVLPIGDPNEKRIRGWASRTGHVVRMIKVERYDTYERQFFIDTLDDWGWHGSGEPPTWYSGRPWSK